MKTKMIKLYVNNRGWVMGLIRDKDEEVVGLRFVNSKEGAKPFRESWYVDPDLYDALYYIENELKCHYDRVAC